jgi:hypothetical protein
MGHYASEIDPDWDKPSASEIKISEVEDERIQNLARVLFTGFNSGSHLDTTNASTGIRVAEAIDELVKVRLEEMMRSNSPTES